MEREVEGVLSGMLAELEVAAEEEVEEEDVVGASWNAKFCGAAVELEEEGLVVEEADWIRARSTWFFFVATKSAVRERSCVRGSIFL